MKRYLVIDEHKNGSGDSWTDVFDTLEAANSKAESAWGYLTQREQSKRRIHVAVVTEEDLADYAIDEDDGTIDWTAFNQYSDPDGGFDSDKEEN